jgi:hypothetical protein
MDDSTRTRYSASALPRIEACPSSIAKIAEVNAFLDAHGGSEHVYRESAMGDMAHEILSKLPYQSKKHGIGQPYNLYKELSALTESEPYRASVDKGLFWFLFRAVQRRDEMIDFCLGEAPGRVSSVEVELDTQRLFADVPVKDGYERFSGLGDVVVRITSEDGDGTRHLTGAIFDYKSGWSALDGQSSRQLMGLAYLLQANNPELEAVHTGLITRDSIHKEAEVFTYDAALLDRAAEATAGLIGASVPLMDAYLAGADREGTPPEEVEQALFEASGVSDHCAYCGGKAACQKLQQTLEAAYAEDMDKLEQLPAAAALSLAGKLMEADGTKTIRMAKDLKPLVIEAVGKSVAKQEGIEEKEGLARAKKMKGGELVSHLDAHFTANDILEIFDMDITKLRKLMVKVQELDRKHTLLEKLQKEANNLTRSYLSFEEDEQMALEPGLARIAMRAGEDGYDPAPADVFAALQEVIPGVSEGDFISATASCNPTMIRSFLAAQLKVDESKVVEHLDKTLGEPNNPLIMREGSPKVVLNVKEEESAKTFVTV